MNILRVEVCHPASRPSYVVFVIESSSGSEYRVDVTREKCSCPAWKFAREDKSRRRSCKHLRALGFVANREVPEWYGPPAPKAPKVVWTKDQLDLL